jgi:hypothetical protein
LDVWGVHGCHGRDRNRMVVGFTILKYLCNQCLSPLKLWVRIPPRRGVLDTTLCDKVCQWLVAGWWFSLVSSTNKTDGHDITKILLEVALNTPTLTLTRSISHLSLHDVVDVWFVSLWLSRQGHVLKQGHLSRKKGVNYCVDNSFQV